MEHVYIDETSQTGHRHLIIGGITFPERYADQFEQDILEARRPKLAAERDGSTELREIGWNEIGKGQCEAYRRVVDAYFNFATKHLKFGEGRVEFHCSVVLTQVRGRAFSRGQKQFNNEVFQHCLKVARYHKTKRFDIYPDRRDSDDAVTKKSDLQLRNRLCRELTRESDSRDWAVRRVKSQHSQDVQGLQLADLQSAQSRSGSIDTSTPTKRIPIRWNFANIFCARAALGITSTESAASTARKVTVAFRFGRSARPKQSGIRPRCVGGDSGPATPRHWFPDRSVLYGLGRQAFDAEST